MSKDKYGRKHNLSLQSRLPKSLINAYKKQSHGGYRVYGPKKLKLVQIFLGKLALLEKSGINVKAASNFVMEVKTRKKEGKFKKVKFKQKKCKKPKYNTFNNYTTKEISGKISQLKVI